MPNYCWNTLIIERSKDYKADMISLYKNFEDVSDGEFFGIIIDWLKNQESVYDEFTQKNFINYNSFDFNKIIKSPDINDTPLGDWYKWNNSNWGTKWNAFDQNMYYDFANKKLIYHFVTAWGPPMPIIDRLTRTLNMAKITHIFEVEGCPGIETYVYNCGYLEKQYHCIGIEEVFKNYEWR